MQRNYERMVKPFNRKKKDIDMEELEIAYKRKQEAKARRNRKAVIAFRHGGGEDYV